MPDSAVPAFPAEPATPPAHWTAVHKDFVEPGTPCARAGKDHRLHRLVAGHAYILRDVDGNERPFGPICARALLGASAGLAGVPDFTARDTASADAGPEAAVSGRRTGDEAVAAQRLAAATRYLLLRMEKVASIPRIQPTVRYAALEPIYADYRRQGTLSPQQVRRVLAIERSPATPAALKAMPLLDVYTAYVQLQRALLGADRLDRQRFLRGLIDWLARHLMLTRAQIEAAGLALHPRAFQGHWG